MEVGMASGYVQLLRELPEALQPAGHSLVAVEGSDAARVEGAAALVAACKGETERELVSTLLRRVLDDRTLLPNPQSLPYGQMLRHLNQLDFLRFPGQLPGGNW